MNLLDTEISYVLNHSTPPERCTLKQAINSISSKGKYYELIKQIRDVETEIQALRIAGQNDKADSMKREVKSPLKLKLPGFIFGAICEGTHNYKSITTKTGIVCIDFDSDAITTPEQWELFRDNLIKVSNVFYTALSVSGAGVMALVKIADSEKQKQYFEQMKIDFTGLLKDYEVTGAKLDISKGSNPAQLRFLTYDPEAKFKPDFKIYDRLPQKNKTKSTNIKRTNKPSPANDVFEYCFNLTKSKGMDFSDGCMHHSIFQLCCYLNVFGVNQHDAEDWINNNVLSLSEIKSNCIDYPFSEFKNDFGKYTYEPFEPTHPKQELIDTSTGEVFDYPPEWDAIQPPPEGTSEYLEMMRIIESEFDTVITT